jgi:hypothetical protein
MLPNAKAAAFRNSGMPIVAWTVRSTHEWSVIADYCDNLIFEGFEA